MATISKFYLLDAATPNTGTMPGAADAMIIDSSFNTAVDGDAVGARTARDATDVAGTSNPDIESTFTALADTASHSIGHRRFVSRPLAAQTFAAADGNWTFSYARSESNLLHNQIVFCTVYVWRPGTGARVSGTGQAVNVFGNEPTVAATEQAESVTATWSTSPLTIQDSDILVFDITSSYTQGMGVAYTEEFAYNGTTEASTTTCATFVTPPAALTLQAAAVISPSAAFQAHRHRLPDGS